MSDKDEIERLKRIRDRQIRLRDPQAKDREVQHRIASRYKKPKLTVKSILEDIPGKWMGTILGAILGTVVAVTLNLTLDFEVAWIEYALYLIVAICAAMGRALGAAMDWREEDHEALVKRSWK